MMTTLGTSSDSHALPGSRLRRVTEYIQQNLDKDLTLAELADVVYMSPYHFARLFKGRTGVPPHRFVVRQRIARARGLLIPNLESLHHGVPTRPGHHARSLQNGGTARRPARPGRRVTWLAL